MVPLPRTLVAVAAAVAVLLPRSWAFEPLPWDEAYRRAEATLAKMDVPLLHVTGLCQRQIFANGLLFQPLGSTANGSPYYGVAGYYIYYDPSCNGKKHTHARWILSASPPKVHRHSDLDDDGSCSKEAHTGAGDADGPPLGRHKWHMLCGDSDTHLSSHHLTLSMVPHGEKLSLLRGLGWEHPPGGWFDLRKWWYIGNTVAIPRLNIPSLNMQDAAGGFRTNFPEMSGTCTVWPSLLAMAATWDPPVVRSFGEALGREFKGKGANAILGPSVNVHRVARNGRNFEYLSGEDPYLGSRLAKAYVEGVQSEGVFAVVKHWVFNEQEINRGSESSVVDEKTAWELYYPPFQAAVDAGVSAAMCSYNKVNGVYSCSNEKELRILHERMGFKGFVQSDWWATHDTSLAAGLDQEMPGIGSGDSSHAEYFAADELEKINQTAVDLAAKRVLAVMHRMNLMESTRCSPPHCKEWFLKHVSTHAHVSLARESAAKSVVMLKNKGDVLPLSGESIKSIAVIGAAADAPSYDPNGQGQGHGDWATGDYYSGGGSGHLSGDVVTPIDGLREHAHSLGIKVVTSLTNNIHAATRVAKEADVAIVVAGATSGESRDRKNLNLDDGADRLIEAVRRVAPTVVLIQAPGAVVMPWRDSVDGILIMFLGGQETGRAWADVIFGDHAPTGRLPIMLPATEADSIPPGLDGDVYYSEGLSTSYRSPSFQAAFPFGHGLTYTTFQYSPLVNESCHDVAGCELRLRTRVSNTGRVAAPTVAQLYLEMPAVAGHPKPFLKGFRKTATLAPGTSEEVVFELSTRDISYYDVGRGDFVRATGAFRAHVGESSADIRQVLRFCAGACDASSILLPVSALLVALTALGAVSWAATTRLLRAVGRDSRGSGLEDAKPLVALQHDA